MKRFPLLLALVVSIQTASSAQQALRRPGPKPVLSLGESEPPPRLARTLDFEGLPNGRALEGYELGGLVALSSSGPNAGAAIFDSTPGGPNDPGPDRDLLVDRGRILILQRAGSIPTEKYFNQPNDEENGGTLIFTFTQPVAARSLELIDLDSGEPVNSFVRLTDEVGRQRTFLVPPGFTRDLVEEGGPGVRRLRLDTLEPQPGAHATATAAEDRFFELDRVLELRVDLGGSGAIDEVRFDFDRPEDVELSGRAYPLHNVVPGNMHQSPRLACGDFDGDGHVDLVGAYKENNLGVLLNNGDGTFRRGAHLTWRSIGVDAGDVDGDGDVDIVTLGGLLPSPPSPFGSGVLVHLNEGGGLFPATPVFSSIGALARGLHLGDVDGDGTLDVVTEPLFSAGNGEIRVLRGLGNGEFEPFGSYPLEPTGFTEGMALGDFNGDGALDFVTDVNNVVRLFLNQGDGTFPQILSVPISGARAPVAGDLDGDGDLDLVVPGQRLTVLRNHGDATFERSNWLVPGNRVGTVAFLDVDVDGDMDLLVEGMRMPGFSNLRLAALLRQEEDGSFLLEPWDASPSEATSSIVADLDGVDPPDAAFLGFTGVVDTLLLRSPGGFHRPRAVTQVPAADNVARLITGDLNGDLAPDLGIVTSTPPFRIAINDGAGGLGAFAQVEIPGEVIGAADVTGDGLLDLVGMDDLRSSLLVHENSPDGFAPPTPYALPGNLRLMAVADFDADGRDDLVVVQEDDDDRLLQLFAREGGRFEERLLGDALHFRIRVAATDLDGDGHIDLAALLQSDLRLFQNDGSGRLSPFFSQPAVLAMRLCGAARVGGDQEASVYFWKEETVFRLPPLGGGAYGDPEPLFESFDSEFEVIDWNVDGFPDLLTGRSGFVTLFTGRPDGTFGPGDIHQGGFRPTVLDLDRDAVPEILFRELLPGRWQYFVLEAR